MESEPTVFIVDDDPAARRVLTAQIGSMHLRSQTFSSATAFLDAYDPAAPGCLLVDVCMPEMSGLELLQRLIQSETDLSILLISAHGDVPMVVQAMKAGALNFLQKPCRDQELWEAIQEGLRRNRDRRTRLSRRARVQRRMTRLTAGELSVLRMLVDGMSNKMMAAELDLSVRTIEVRRAKVMRKMKAGSLAELVRVTLDADESFGRPSTSVQDPD